MGRLFLNTAYVGIVSTILSLVITVLSAIAFARLEFKGKDLIFGALLGTWLGGALDTLWLKKGFGILLLITGIREVFWKPKKKAPG